ncbi:MAG: dephospho-CoA kinase [Pseudomarimonas sp.]
MLGATFRVPVIGLTGGIASGKSAVLREFERGGATTYDADMVARELVEPGQPALDAIVHRFGKRMLDPSGRLDRRQLRAHVFSDHVERRALEAILHPAIRSVLRERCLSVLTGYVVVAIPLLVESGRYDWLSRVLVVDVADEVQVRRVMQRDGVEVDQARAAIAAQATRAARLALADDVIVNNGPITLLAHAVDRLDRTYRRLPAVG